MGRASIGAKPGEKVIAIRRRRCAAHVPEIDRGKSYRPVSMIARAYSTLVGESVGTGLVVATTADKLVKYIGAMLRIFRKLAHLRET